MRRALAAGLADVGEASDEDGNNLLDDDFVMQAAGADDVRFGYPVWRRERSRHAAQCVYNRFRYIGVFLDNGLCCGGGIVLVYAACVTSTRRAPLRSFPWRGYHGRAV